MADDQPQDERDRPPPRDPDPHGEATQLGEDELGAAPTHLSEDDLPGSARTDGSESAPASTPESGPRTLGDFELLSELGRGGMGVVYEARQISLKRRVALKVLPPALGLNPQARKRFEREAQAAARMHHTNIVPVHAIGEHEGQHFYAMDLIDGQGLDAVLSDLVGGRPNSLMDATVMRAAKEARPRSVAPVETRLETPARREKGDQAVSDSSAGGREWFDTMARLVAEVADGLHYAHERGIIHRDIKPANLMLSKAGRLCVTDFGLARVLQEPGMTVSGSFMGTPAYMSPEQIAAGRAGLDHRTDVYSLGAVLYELLTLQRAFPGDSREEILSGVLTKDPRPPRRVNPKVPLDLETVCLKAMEKDPDLRYATAAEFAEDLRQYLQRGLIAARRAGLARRAVKSVRRHPAVATAVAAGALMVLLVGGVLWLGARRSASEKVERLVLDGRLAWETSMYETSLERAEEALAIDPASPEARLLRARALVHLDRVHGAAKEARERLATDPDDWVSHLILAYAGTNAWNPDPSIDAEAHARALGELAPESSEAYFVRAQIVSGPREKLEFLDRALEIDPLSAAALKGRIDVYARDLMDFQSALLDCERLIASRPRSPQGYRLKASVLSRMFDYDTAFEAVERAIAMTDGAKQPHEAMWNFWTRAYVHAAREFYRDAIADHGRALEVNADFAQALESRARNYNRVGEYDAALTDARRAIGISPSSTDAHQRLLETLWHLQETDELRDVLEKLGTVAETWRDDRARATAHAVVSRWYARLGDHENALEHAEWSVSADPDYLWGCRARLLARQRLEGDSGIEEDCDRMVLLDLEDLGDDLTRARYLASLCKRPEGAVESFDRIVSRAPHWADPFYYRGRFHASRAEYTKASADFDRAIDRAPAWADPWRARGLVHKDRKRFEEALSDISRAIELEPENTNAIFNRALVFIGLERFEEALADLGHCFELSGGKSLTGRWYQAKALLRLGREEEALAALDKGIENHPDSDLAVRRRAILMDLMGHTGESLEVIERAIELSPGSAWNHLVRARAFLHGEGNCARALADLGTARRLAAEDPLVDDEIAWQHSALLFWRCPGQSDPRLALELARTAVEDQPGDPDLQNHFGLALYRRGRFAEANRALLRAAELRVPEPDASDLFALAMCEWKLGRRAGARTYFDRAVARMEATYPRYPVFLRLRDEAARLLGL